MIKNILAKAVEDLLEHAGEDAKFSPSFGADITLRVCYGKSSSMPSFGSFEARDYEHQFLCLASQVTGKTRGSQLILNGRAFSIEDVQTDGPAAILYGE